MNLLKKNRRQVIDHEPIYQEFVDNASDDLYRVATRIHSDIQKHEGLSRCHDSFLVMLIESKTPHQYFDGLPISHPEKAVPAALLNLMNAYKKTDIKLGDVVWLIYILVMTDVMEQDL